MEYLNAALKKYQDLIKYNLELNLSDNLKKIFLFSLCKISINNEEGVEIFNCHWDQYPELFRKYDPLNIEKISNSLYQRRVCLQKYIDEKYNNSDLTFLDDFADVVISFFDSEKNEINFIYKDLDITITKKILKSFIFGKGTERLIVLYLSTCDDLQANRLPDLNKVYRNFDSHKKCLFESILIVSLQVFSDGNHRSSYWLIQKCNFEIKEEIFYDFTNNFLGNQTLNYPEKILDDPNINRLYAEKFTSFWNNLIPNKFIVKRAEGENGKFFLQKSLFGGSGFKYITNPETGRKVLTIGKLGKKIIKNYIIYNTT